LNAESGRTILEYTLSGYAREGKNNPTLAILPFYYFFIDELLLLLLFLLLFPDFYDPFLSFYYSSLPAEATLLSCRANDAF